MAESLVDALLLEKQASVEHIWLDDNQPTELTPAIGFNTDKEYTPYSEELKLKK